MRYLPLAAILLALASAAPATAAEQQELDYSALRQLPVFHDGRIMPLDTFAREAVEVICDRQRPELSLKEGLPFDGKQDASPAERQEWLDKQLNHPVHAGARSLFPDDEPRRFDSIELLFSWLVEPDKWEEVPFLIAEHDELRTKYLELSTTNADGEHLRYVSPRQFEEADALHQRLAELQAEMREVNQNGETFQLTGVDKKIDELWRAYRLYRQLQLDTRLDPTARNNFQQSLQVAATTWFSLSERLGLFREMGGASGLPAQLDAADQAIQQLGQLFNENQLERADADAAARQFQQATKNIADEFARFRARMQDNPPGLEPERVAELRATLEQLADETDTLASQSGDVLAAVYQSAEPLQVVPALNAEALELDRDTEDPPQPWLDLESLLLSPAAGPPGFPRDKVDAVKSAFARLKTSYAESADRPNDFVRDQVRFSDSLRALGESIEPLRERLALDKRDENMIAYTAYPAATFTQYEVLYNGLDPFKYCWIIYLVSLLMLGLSFGKMRGPMFTGAIIMLAIGMGMTVYGFALRIIITGWAPVTNMYETVIYVPFVVAVLGTWFLLLPMVWDGVKAAWRLSAIPGTWEARDPQEPGANLFSPRGWFVGNLLVLGPRVALTALTFYVLSMADYAAGGRHIINLLPIIDVGQRLPDFNDAVTWLVGLSILIPTVWYLPRVVVTNVLALVTIPMTLLRGRESREKRSAAVLARWPFAYAAAMVAFFGSFVAWYSPVLDKGFSPLQPVLRDNFWLLIHVLTIVSSYGAGALAWGLGLIALCYYTFGRYRKPAGALALSAAGGPADNASDEEAVRMVGHREPVDCGALSNYIYKAIQVAVLLLAAGTILGGLWADVAWGRFWGWDPKEVWALISCLVYLALLHARFAGLIGHFGLTAGTILGASAITMSWYGVNFVLGAGLHSYGFGDGGQGYVYSAVAANWLFLAVAAGRYYYETKMNLVPVPKPTPVKTTHAEAPEPEPVGVGDGD